MVQMANRIEHHTANSDQSLSRKGTSPNPKSLQATLRNENQNIKAAHINRLSPSPPTFTSFPFQFLV